MFSCVLFCLSPWLSILAGIALFGVGVAGYLKGGVNYKDPSVGLGMAGAVQFAISLVALSVAGQFAQRLEQEQIALAEREQQTQAANQEFARLAGMAERYIDRGDVENAERTLASAEAMKDVTNRQAADAVRMKIEAERTERRRRVADEAVEKAFANAEPSIAAGREFEAAINLLQALEAPGVAKNEAAEQRLAQLLPAAVQQAVEQQRYLEAHRLLQAYFANPDAVRTSDLRTLLDALGVVVDEGKAREALVNMRNFQVDQLEREGAIPPQFDTGKEQLNKAVLVALARHAGAEQQKRRATRLAREEEGQKQNAEHLAQLDSDAEVQPQQGDNAERASPQIANMTPLEQAEIAFVGGYSQGQFKTQLDRAFQLYGLPSTPENYSRAASVLVALRKQNGTPEMAILGHMIRSHVPGVNIDFPQAAALSSAFLVAGDR